MATDKNYESHASENGSVIENRFIPNGGVHPLDYSDILKFSNCTGITVNNCSIYGGKEDCIDGVRGQGYTVRNTNLIPVHNGVTMKGSIDGVVLENITFETHGEDCDMEFGQFDNYWYIGRPPTRNITIRNVISADGSTVRIRLWDSETPKVENSNIKIIRIPKFIWWFYFVYRAIQTRGWKNIKTPVADGTFISTR